MPPWERSSERSSCTKRSKARSSSSGAMPMPWSRTVTSTSSPSTETSTSIAPAGSEYLAALLSRLPKTWTRRAESA